MHELRLIADNIVREQCKHSDVHPPTRSGMASYTQTSNVADATDDVHPPVSPHSASIHGDVHAGPAFDIPMTQGKSLEDLPSQLDFDWQDSAIPGTNTALASAQTRGESPERAAQPIDVELDAFAGISQIAHEAVMDATQQPPGEVLQSLSPTTTADAPKV